VGQVSYTRYAQIRRCTDSLVFQVHVLLHPLSSGCWLRGNAHVPNTTKRFALEQTFGMVSTRLLCLDTLCHLVARSLCHVLAHDQATKARNRKGVRWRQAICRGKEKGSLGTSCRSKERSKSNLGKEQVKKRVIVRLENVANLWDSTEYWGFWVK
jgi:hypothetical protein